MARVQGTWALGLLCEWALLVEGFESVWEPMAALDTAIPAQDAFGHPEA